MTEQIYVRVPRELYDILNAEATSRGGCPLGDIVAPILAKAFDRPDLGVVPRKLGGRPRKPRAETVER